MSNKELEVRGSVGEAVERVDVLSGGTRTSIRVVSRAMHSWGSDSEAHLVFHVPARSMVSAPLVSADFKVSGLSGDLKLQAVSGNVSGDVDITTVSGSATLELGEVSRGR
jgi:hypothetical protein